MILEQSEEEKKKQLEQQNAPFGEQTIGAGGGAQIQANTSTATPNASRLSPTTQSTPQNFGTIQDYFKGSQEQGERFGEQFTGRLDTAQQEQRETIGRAAETAGGNITAGTLGFNEALVSQAVSDPTQVTGDEGQFQDFLNQWNAAYRGPQSFAGSQSYGGAAKAAHAAGEKAAQLGSTGGRQQLIQDEFGVYG